MGVTQMAAGWGNNELQCYLNTSAVARVQASKRKKGDGRLVITALRKPGSTCYNNLVGALYSFSNALVCGW
jgi:hypothetical protein